MNIGIDLGGSHIAVGKVEGGTVKEKREIKITDIDRQNIIEFIEENILQSIEEIYKYRKQEEQNLQLETIGIAIPGTVSDNKIIKCINLGIENYDIVDRIKTKLEKKYQISNIKIKLANDAKCAAIAENRYGCLKGYENAVFLTLGTGIGGAAIVNNKLLKAKNVPGYEFGHMTINMNSEEKCKCGKIGCFEQYASMKVFKNNLRKVLNLNEYASGIQLYDILKYNKALNKDDEKINEVIDEFVKYLSIGLSNLINIFEPDIIGIGGSYVYFEEFITEKLIKSEDLLFNKRDDIIIKSAELGNEAGIVGASIIAQEE